MSNAEPMDDRERIANQKTQADIKAALILTADRHYEQARDWLNEALSSLTIAWNAKLENGPNHLKCSDSGK